MGELSGTLQYFKGLEGVAVTESSISYVDGVRGKLLYRGFDVEDLVEHSTFEEVAYLLWYGHLPSEGELCELREKLMKFRKLPEEYLKILKTFPLDVHPMDFLRASVSLLGLFSTPDECGENTRMDCAIRLTAQLPMLVAIFHRRRMGKELNLDVSEKLGHAANFLYMLRGKPPESMEETIMDKALILHAEQEMNASTFAAVVTASTLSDMYSAVTSAIGTLKGPIHGGANEKVVEMLEEIGDPEEAEDYVERCLAEGRRIMGFGHRIYKTYDPRARILKKWAETLVNIRGGRAKRHFEIAMKLEKAVTERLGNKGIYPNVDFYSGIVYECLGIPKDLFTTIFAVARVVGWTAHVIEYNETNRIFRPRAIYKGPMNLNYKIEKSKR